MRQSVQNNALFTLILFCTGCSAHQEREQVNVVSSAPETNGDMNVDGTIVLQFDDYIDPGRIDESKISLKSGELEIGYRLGYDVVDRSLLVSGRYPLRPGIAYTLTLESHAVRGLTGSEFRDRFEMTVQTRPSVQSKPKDERLATVDNIEKIFERSCGCHGPEPKAFPHLEAVDLINQVSARQPEFKLVEPGQPLKSYLVLRLLDAYPGIRGPAKDVEADDVRLIIDWVSRLSDG